MVDRGAHIDLFFRNGLKEFEVLPPSDVWENIKPAIRKKHRPFVFLRVAAIGAIFVSLGAISFLLTRNLSDKFNNMVISFNQDAIPEGNYVVKAVQVPAVINKESHVISAINVSDNSNFVASLEEDPNKLNENRLSDVPLMKSSSQKNIINDSFINVKLNPSYSSTGLGTNLIPEVPGIIKSDIVGSRWSISALATPTYYSNLNLGENEAAKNLIKSEKAAISYSGGVAFDYKVNKRISVQTGLYYSSFGQKVTGVSSFAGFHSFNESKSGSNFVVQTSSGTITSSNNDIFLMDNNTGTRVLTRYTIDVFDPYKADLQYIDNSILQNFNYLEIPFFLKYKVIDRKVDFNLVGGLSYNLLISNSAYSVSGGEKYFIGKTAGLSPTTFSSSLGLGMEYNLSSKISLNFEPTFRYYLTPVSGSVGSTVHPYSFGILSGFSYKF
jgi:hypothetical protein